MNLGSPSHEGSITSPRSPASGFGDHNSIMSSPSQGTSGPVDYGMNNETQVSVFWLLKKLESKFLPFTESTPKPKSRFQFIWGIRWVIHVTYNRRKWDPIKSQLIENWNEQKEKKRTVSDLGQQKKTLKNENETVMRCNITVNLDSTVSSPSYKPPTMMIYFFLQNGI